MVAPVLWPSSLANYPYFLMVALLLGVLLGLWRWHRKFLQPTLWVLAGVSVSALILGGGFWWEVTEGRRYSLVGPRSNELAQDVKNKLEGYEKRADDLEKLLSLLVGLTAVYGLVLGLNAYVQAKESADKLDKIRADAIQQAKDSAARLKQIEDDAQREAQKLPAEMDNLRNAAHQTVDVIKNDAQHSLDRIQNEADQQVRDFIDKVRNRFPILEGMDDGIRAMVVRITRLLPVIDWTDDKYKRLQPQDKQEILYYEKAIAALEPFDLRSVRRDVSEIFHGLGNFYGQKYSTEREEHKTYAGKPQPLDDDKERSRFYLDRSLSQDRSNVGALNDRVFFALNIDPGLEEYKKAMDLCQDSLKWDSEQQRARYNLALLKHVVRKDYRESERLLTEALAKTTWQLSQPASHHFSILYNRACGRARLSELDQAMQDLEGAIPAQMPSDPFLRAQFLADIPQLKTTLPEDLGAPAHTNPDGGDLYVLSITAGYQDRTAEVVRRLTAY
jgi:archaellum component FlaC